MKTVGALTLGRLARIKRQQVPIVESKKYSYLINRNVESKSELISALCSLFEYDSVKNHVEAYINEQSNPKNARKELLKAYKRHIALEASTNTVEYLSHSQRFVSLLLKSGYNEEDNRKVTNRYIEELIIPAIRQGNL